MKNLDRRNKYFFGLGTIGRDMFYAFEANALLYFLSNCSATRFLRNSDRIIEKK